MTVVLLYQFLAIAYVSHLTIKINKLVGLVRNVDVFLSFDPLLLFNVFAKLI